MKKARKMPFKKKLVFLSSAAASLFLVYVLTFVFDPQRQQTSTFEWLPERLHILADRIEITGLEGGSILVRRNDVWFLLAAGNEYPVRQQRVQDLFAALSRREAYSIRSTSLHARESLGLSAENASRILVRGGIGLPLLDLFIGISDALGSYVYVAEADRREIFSGVDRFSIFTDSGPEFWLDFRLFSGGGIPNAIVQQAEVTFGGVSYTLRREGAGWVIVGSESLDVLAPRVEAWLRSVLEAEGAGFAASTVADITNMEGSITLWLGDGTSRAVHVGTAENGDGRLLAAAAALPLVYVLSPWTAQRLFVESGHFLL